MTNDELLRAIDAAIQSTGKALDAADRVEPKGHRVSMARSQLEAGLDTLLRARSSATAKGSGTFDLSELPASVKKP